MAKSKFKDFDDKIKIEIIKPFEGSLNNEHIRVTKLDLKRGTQTFEVSPLFAEWIKKFKVTK